MTRNLLSLKSGESRCTVSADIGGSIMSLRLDGIDVLRTGDPSAEDALASSSFPMIPFCNRVAKGTIWSGAQLDLLPDPAAPHHALHGHGWRNPWRILYNRSDEALLEYIHQADEWPWSYRTQQHFRLHPYRLDLVVKISNMSDHPMPCGCGIHPYFLLGNDSFIESRAQTCLGPDGRGIASISTEWRPGRHRVAELPPIDTFLIDRSPNLKVGNDHWAVRIEASDVAGWQLYRPQKGNYFCLEPVSHLPGQSPPILSDALRSTKSTKRWRFSIAL